MKYNGIYFCKYDYTFSNIEKMICYCSGNNSMLDYFSTSNYLQLWL